MGIIVSCFKGCGHTYFTEDKNDTVKVLEKLGELGNSDIDEIMNAIEKYDFIFVDSSEKTRELLEERNIDFDVFYPSIERRGEFIENQVKNHTPMKEIRELDKNFNDWVKSIDEDEAESCHKHKMNERGHFLSNDPLIIEYINSLHNKTENK